MARGVLWLCVISLTIFQASATIPNPFTCLLPCCCPSNDDDCEPAAAGYSTPAGVMTLDHWRPCTGKPAAGHDWACAAPGLDFFTVDCLIQDIQTCGLLNAGPMVFYSFGTKTPQAREHVRDKLPKKGVMFNDGLLSTDDWYRKTMGNPRFGMLKDTITVTDPTKKSHGLNRYGIFVARYAEALASVATGDVWMVYKNYEGEGGLDKDHGNLGGIYQKPRPADAQANVWRSYEFPTIQRKGQVQHVYGVEVATGFALDKVEWKAGQNQPQLPLNHAMDLELPPLAPADPASHAKRTACVSPKPSASKSTSATPVKSSSTGPAKSSSTGPTKSSSGVPAKSSSGAPTKSSSGAPVKSSSGAPVKSSSGVSVKPSATTTIKSSVTPTVKSSTPVKSTTKPTGTRKPPTK